MIRISFVDPSRLLSDAMRTVLGQEQDIYVVGCATNSEEALYLMPHCNIALINATLGKAAVLSLMQAISQNYPRVQMLVSGFSDDESEILDYIEAGAIGYASQTESLTSLLKKIRAAQAGEAIVSPNLAARMMARLSQLASQPAHFTKITNADTAVLQALTNREMEILELISNGDTNRSIAEKLYIQCGTVKNHVHNILKKLDARSRQDAASLYQIHQEANVALA